MSFSKVFAIYLYIHVSTQQISKWKLHAGLYARYYDSAAQLDLLQVYLRNTDITRKVHLGCWCVSSTL